MKKLLFNCTGIFVFLALFFGTATEALAYTHGVTLRLGSQGAQVMDLQRGLNQIGYTVASAGAGAPGFETMYFGPLTRSAVVRFQAAQGLAADGIVGPMTGGRLATLTAGGPVSTVPGCQPGFIYSVTTGRRCDGSDNNNGDNNGSLSGDDGTIEEVTRLSQFSNEEVGEGDDEARVLGFDVEASNEGDIALRSIHIEFDSSGSSGSNNLDDYIDSVSVWMDDDEIGTADVENFSEDDDVFSRTVTLDRSIIRSNETERFYITVDAADNLDSGDISGDSWTISLESIRYEDGAGVLTTEDEAGDLPITGVGINFVDFDTAADTDIRITAASDNPDEDIVIVDEDDTTDDVVLLRGTLRINGDSDVTIDELPVTLISTGTGDVDLITNSLTLEIDGEEYGESVNTAGSSGTITFNDLELEIASGDTVEFEIRADINDIDDGDGNNSAFDQGDTLRAEINSTNRDNIDIENEEGDQIDNSDLSGTAIGEEQEFRSEGLSAEFVSQSATATTGSGSNDDLGTFRIRFRVTAVGDDIFIPEDASDAIDYAVDRTGTDVGSGTSATLINLTDNDTTGADNYLIEEGETETFELTVTVQLPAAGSAGQYRARLEAINWDTDDAASPDNSYTSNLDQFRTSYLGLN